MGETILEILKYILPALIVFLTVYFILKKYLDNQYKLELLRFKQSQLKDTLPLKLQAYERLAMLCERISLDSLSYRLSSSNMDTKSLSSAMLIAIQQEFEHNNSQQVYVSDKLWQIMTTAKDQIQKVITTASADPTTNGSTVAFVEKAKELLAQTGDPVSMAKQAIKQELELIF